MTTTAPSDPWPVLLALPLEDGSTWGNSAHPFQLDDARAILNPEGPRRHAILRGRGMSKTTDVAAILLALLVTAAPARARLLIYAADADQAGIFADALAGFVTRANLGALVDVGARTFTHRQTGATIAIETSDGASAFGARPWFQVMDEFSLWPSTANHRRLSSAIQSAVAKVPGGRLVMIGTAGSPVGLGRDLWDLAEANPAHWRTVVTSGPSPWWSADDVAATRASLTASEWARLIECRWAESDDALTSAEDVDAAIRAGSVVLPPRPGIRYVAALDVGTRRDLTALAVGHTETRDGGRVTVIDRIMAWAPTSGGRVDLAEVEAAVLRVCLEYRVTRLRFDRMQAEQLSQNLGRAGVPVSEFVFSSAGANRLARGLFNALRDRALELPDDPTTREQFVTTRLVETGPGVVKLSNPVGHHDDIPTTVGMVVAELAANPVGTGAVTTAVGRRMARPTPQQAMTTSFLGTTRRGRALVGTTANGAPTNWLLRQRRNASPRGLPGGPVLGVPGAYDDRRRPGGPLGGQPPAGPAGGA